MAERVALRYCGGCNPRYDRSRVVLQLSERFPSVEFVPYVASQVNLLVVLVVCGCVTACASQHDLPECVPRLLISAEEKVEQIQASLLELIKEC